VGVMLLGLAATMSRAAILGASCALVFALWAGKDRTAGRGYRGGAALLALLLAAAVWANREGIERKFEAATAVGRVVIWRETAPLVRDFWFAGTGAGTYGRAMLRYQRTEPELHFNQAHSEYVQLVAEGGVLLTLPVLIAAGAWLRLARRQFRREGYEAVWIRIGAAAGLLGAAVQGIFETGWRVPANACLCALLAAIVISDRAAGRRS
jgi:O-antigen ligase